jgi:hypothetical protein
VGDIFCFEVGLWFGLHALLNSLLSCTSACPSTHDCSLSQVLTCRNIHTCSLLV